MDKIPPEQLANLAKEDQGPLTRNIVIVFTVISFTSVCLRIYTRLRYKAVGWEDYSIVIAMMLSLATGVCQVLQVHAGNGKHAVFVPFPEGVEMVLKYLFWSIIAYNSSLTFIKVSIILQYRRLFTLREMRLPLNLALVICIAWGVTTLFTSIFTCVPVQAYWRVLEKATARCMDDATLWFTNASINIFTDLMVAILPIKTIWSLHIPKMQKIALLGILTIGWFVCVVSFLRLHALIVFSKHPEDQTYYSSGAAYWSSIEMNLGIVCASLPALKPLIVKIIPAFSTRHGSRGYGTANSGRVNQNLGTGSKATRDTHNEDVELEIERINTNAYSARPSQDVRGNNIYVRQDFEQRFEKHGHSSDNESQKELVAT